MGDENSIAGTTKAHKHSATSSDGGFLETSVTGMTNLSQGSMIYGNASEIQTELTIGVTDGHVLTVSSGLPVWADPSHTTIPAGSVMMWAGLYDAIPSGYLLCDGSELDRTTYADLFSAIGTQFGSTSGTTFTLPLFEDKFPRSPAVSTSAGGTGGADSLTLTEAQMPTHNHTINDSGHTHPWAGHKDYQDNAGNYFQPTNNSTYSKTVPSATTGITINDAGSSNSFDNRPSYLEVNFIIKT